jgi:hypothetical protein
MSAEEFSESFAEELERAEGAEVAEVNEAEDAGMDADLAAAFAEVDAASEDDSE